MGTGYDYEILCRDEGEVAHSDQWYDEDNDFAEEGGPVDDYNMSD